MKHAIIIIADKDLPLLTKTISYFDERFLIYIAIDKKSKIEIEDLINQPGVVSVRKKYYVNWGGWNMVQYSIDFIIEILTNPEIKFAHLISGSDYPLKNIDHLFDFFEENKSKNFISYQKLPVPWSEWGGNGGLDRLRYFYFMDTLNVRKKYGRYLNSGIISIQKKLKIKRKLDVDKLPFCIGSQWWSLPTSTLRDIISFLEKNPWVYSVFKKTYVPDEMFFQTLIHKTRTKDQIDSENFRYFDWNIRDDQNTRPAILNESDWEKVKQTNAFFGRKFDSKKSKKLLDKIDTEILRKF
ncbi:beta-1,6-N-acetylglucosaminyltransferase [Rhizosphaericola mali]|uniref:Peptide O-xylosyltransferase n=1 Tax=Rhizosphaericola mali TaxID=2545455 RepID=A0A5P2G7L0_9BACT|nr:beta-1,6-N-acetylglucosaminyltransferase [Rhizosphaericola mali]QES89193.1 beta-1,6-N-acetylglucosaminyltransferase [Rhizosphaericola mali]